MALVLFHTAEQHIAAFSALAEELAPDLEIKHVVRADLLAAAQAEGLTDEIREDAVSAMRAARGPDDRLLCTCSTLGPAADDAAEDGTPILRIDRPMAEAAVAAGNRIALLATLEGTLAPSRALLEEAAKKASKPILIGDLLLPEAWARNEAGDRDGYLNEIARGIEQAASAADVIVLAQASMAPAAERAGVTDIPVLSSPRLGFQAAL